MKMNEFINETNMKMKGEKRKIFSVERKRNERERRKEMRKKV